MRVVLFEELSQGFDPEARAKFLDGLLNGFRLGVEEDPPPRGWAPSFTNDASRARITAYFETEVAGKRMLGPFTTCPSHGGRPSSAQVSCTNALNLFLN